MALRNIAAILVTIAFFGFQAYIALVKQFTPMLQSPIHLIFALTLVFIYFPADYNYRRKVRKSAENIGEVPDPVILNKYSWWNYIDILAFAGIAYMLWYILSQSVRLNEFVIGVEEVFTMDHAAMIIMILLLLVAVYRTLGGVLAGFITVFIIFAWTSPYLPGIFYTKLKPFAQFIEEFTSGMTMTESGVFGTPLLTSANTLFYFIVFGAFFSTIGGGQLLIDMGMKLSNQSSGGPAKAAVLSSGLMGMISGSAVANVATTGVMTIPMMKKIGYEPEEAGAVEAVASTSGQIMPPIMGVGAFIMAEMLGINYMSVAASAIIPAVAYYFAVFVLVDKIAAKRAANLDTTADSSIRVERPIMPRLYLLVPAILLVIWIVRGYSLMRAGMVGIFTCLVCDVINYFVNKQDFLNLKQLWDCCVDGAKQAAAIAIPTAACGIIINVVTQQTSLATNLSVLIRSLGTNYLFIAMCIAMVGCMILGMALPTVAAYLVGVILFVPCIQPILLQTGLPRQTADLCANMFVFYYGIMAQITPPVCVASYTAAGIAGADAMKTGLKGFTFAMVGFLVPFVFVYNPPLLLKGSVSEIIIAVVQLALGTYFLAVMVAGYYKTRLNTLERVILFAAALSLIAPEIISSAIGAVVGVAILFLNAAKAKKEKGAN
ncbi:MAG: TRAP transporter fused permease subunit [Synergistaceae bacterium]|nr:TRAP transporter fused permease subunit [Synergistaceae bacterium]